MKQLRHACKMVWRNRKSYMLLSVTVVLTFSFLLGYLLYTDSTLYNKYKNALSMDRSVVKFSGNGWSDSRMDIVLEKTQAAGTVKHYPMLEIHTDSFYYPSDDGDRVIDYYPTYCFIPASVWALYETDSGGGAVGLRELDIQWLDGEQHDAVALAEDEVIMERRIFQFLGLDPGSVPVYELRLRVDGSYALNGDVREGRSIAFPMKVVGIVDIPDTFAYETDDTILGNIYLPMSLIDQIPMEILTRRTVEWNEYYYTDMPEVAIAVAEDLSIVNTVAQINFTGVCRIQNIAIKAINNANRNKAIIAAALFVILGISLYSCFTNALKDRKFEIGVKRAIGASGWSIIRQFLYEGLLVMGADILLSVALIADLAVIYKYVLSRMPEMVERYEAFIIYLSPWSAGMFALCAMGLTIGFSLIFAWQSTQVQIVDYLKAE